MTWLQIKLANDENDIIGLFIQLDMVLTGKDQRAAEHMARNQARLVDQVGDWEGVEYYLSDGGYSRLVLNIRFDSEPPKSHLRLTSNSREPVQLAFAKPEAQIIKRQIESRVNQFLADYEF